MIDLVSLQGVRAATGLPASGGSGGARCGGCAVVGARFDHGPLLLPATSPLGFVVGTWMGREIVRRK